MFLCNKLSSFFSLFEVILISLSIFPNNAPLFPKKPLIFPKNSSFSGKVWEKACSKIGVFSFLLLIFCDFSLFFPAERVGFLFFPRNARFFPKLWVFRGSCGKGIVLPYFLQYFCSVEETRQRRNGLVLLKTSSYNYIVCILRL